MNIKDLKTAAKIIDSIKEIDNTIFKIETFATLVANGITKSSFDLKIQNLSNTEETPKITAEEITNGLAYIMHAAMSPYPTGLASNCEFENKKAKPDVLSVDLNETETLQFLGLILGVKQRERKTVLDQLADLGVVLK